MWGAGVHSTVTDDAVVLGRVVNSIVTDDAVVLCIEYVPDAREGGRGGRVWAGADDGKVLIYNSSSAALISTLALHTGSLPPLLPLYHHLVSLYVRRIPNECRWFSRFSPVSGIRLVGLRGLATLLVRLVGLRGLATLLVRLSRPDLCHCNVLQC